MIIRVGLLDRDEVYISRLANYYSTHTSGAAQLELHLYTDALPLKSQVRNLDVLVADESMLDDPEEYAQKTILSFWSTDKHEIDRAGRPVICRYQRANEIFRQIQSLAASLKSQGSNYQLNETGRILLFLAGSGGAGCSTVAAGCASYFAKQGKNTIYFSMKQNEEKSLFHNSGRSMTDVRYEIAMWRQLGGTNMGQLQVRLNSMLKKDDMTGVLSFAPFDMPVSAMNLEPDDTQALLQAMKGLCQICVISADAYLAPALLKAIQLADWTVVVSNSTPDGNEKASKLLKSLETIDSMDEKLIMGNVGVIYNMFGSTAQKTDLPNYVQELGTIAKYKNADKERITAELIHNSVYAGLVN
ncbi:MAG: hypothetical protein ACI4JC_02290 [Faecalibacterium sp.]